MGLNNPSSVSYIGNFKQRGSNRACKYLQSLSNSSVLTFRDQFSHLTQKTSPWVLATLTSYVFLSSGQAWAPKTVDPHCLSQSSGFRAGGDYECAEWEAGAQEGP